MTGRHPRRGFSLLEVVLAVTLTVGLLTAMFGFYRHAARVKDLVTTEVERVGAVRAVMGLMTRELRSAFVVRYLGQGIEGTDTSVRVASVTLPSGAVWVEQGAAEASPVPPERDVQIVGYRVRVVEDEDGELIVVGLDRTCQRLLTAREAEEGQEIEVTLVTPHIRFLRLRYWDGSTWIESWSDNALPRAVEIVLGYKPLPEDVEPVDYPYPTHRRVVSIPGAARGQEGTVIRGLDEAGGMGR